MIQHPSYYDTESTEYHDLINDENVVVDAYKNLLQTVLEPAGWCEPIHIFASSAAIGVALRSYCPPTMRSEFMSAPLTRRVCGRNVSSSSIPICTLMWTQMNVPTDDANFRPNHFVVLAERNSNKDDHNYSLHASTPNEQHKHSFSCSASIIIVDDLNNHCISQSAINKAILLDDITDDVLNCSKETQSADEGPDDVIETGENKDIVDAGDEEEIEMDASKRKHHAVDDNPLRQSDAEIDEGRDETQVLREVANGGRVLPNGAFLEIDELMMLFENDDSEIYKSIPPGLKENCFFMINNTNNHERRIKGKASAYYDDCGTWDDSGCSPTSLFLRDKNGRNFRNIVKRNDLYCIMRHTNRKRTPIPINPQPDVQNVITVHRSYAKLKSSPDYRRRVTWTSENGDRAIVEYIGKWQPSQKHGNRTCGDAMYIRTAESVFDNIRKKLPTNHPSDVYQNLVLENSITTAPSCVKQVKNIIYNDKRKKEGVEGNKANFADCVQTLDMLVNTHPFVQRVIHGKDKVPTVILYTENQLADIKSLCCNGNVGQSTILGVDKTFNLGPVHVTTTVFKHLKVYRKETGEPPIILGPMFLHGNSDFKTFHAFFSHLSGELADCPNQPFFGSDDEQALRKAIRNAFPESSSIVCTRHLRNNIDDYLTDKVVISKNDRNRLLDQIFGKDGVASTNDTMIFDQRLEDLKGMYDSIAPEFASYFEKRVQPILRENFETCKWSTLPMSWTNNNCESANHQLKQAVNWKSQSLIDLVDTLHKFVQGQYKELERALVGVGNFDLAQSMRKFKIDRQIWINMNNEKRKNRFDRFLRSIVTLSPGMQVSSDGCLSVPTSAAGGEKPGQRKRKRTAKTTTITSNK